MSQDHTLLNQVWSTLFNALNDIFELRSMNTAAFMAHYNSVDKYFRSNEYSENLIASSLKNSAGKTAIEADGDERIIPGGELYFNVKNFFRTYLEKVLQKEGSLQGEDFLRSYAKVWESYQFSSQIANGVLAMINRNWVTRQIRDGIISVCDVYTTAMQIWQDQFFRDSNQSLIQICLHIINDNRLGQLMNASLVRLVVQSYIVAGFVRSERNHGETRTITESLATYVKYFEKPFLEETEKFYILESTVFLEKNPVMDYVRKVYQRLKEEEDRVRDILHPTTREKLIPILDRILIEEHLDVLYNEARIALRANERIEDLRLIFGLTARIPRATGTIEIDLEKYALQFGMDAISEKSTVTKNEPKVYVEIIIDVLDKFSRIVREALDNHQGCKSALDRAFSKSINDNAVTQEATKKSAKSAELLARYCDISLRKGNKSEEADVEKKLDQIMAVFNYIIDKDVFQKFYGARLAKRLVEQSSSSNDYEQSMISKLKAACGFEYSSKLQRMFHDMDLSTALGNEYESYRQSKRMTNEKVKCSVMVLTSNSWPFTPAAPFELPIELTRTLESFKTFYSGKYNGRKLECLYQHCKGELQTFYSMPKFIEVSIYQMTVLLLFNESKSIPVQDILDRTKIEHDLCMQVIFGLLKSQILTSSQVNASQLAKDYSEHIIQPDYIIEVNENFRGKKMKINLNQTIKSVEQKENDAVSQTVDEDRKILIQAKIVQKMKVRKTLKHTILLQEIIPELVSRFKPEISMIKKCIDILIEKEYLERDANERDLYYYKA